ncbi:MAG: prepilin-type N-terminal cleavage/methylation domain-containing protein [Firmicutes bacterium]|nr:prepilin-type N-terminal cleavage/methylation domain-containing protein [Bacillota bacterium]
MKRKGFTLIELLAVIVILAIIALIAVPVIMNIISSARKSAFEDTAYGLISAGEMYYANNILSGATSDDVEFTITNGEFVGENKLEVKGSLPASGKVKVTKDGKVAIAVNNGNYCITKATSESKIQTEELAGECTYRKVLNPIVTSTEACITNVNEICGDDVIKAGIAVQVKVNDKEEAKTFYVVKDNATTGTLTLIMDRNIDQTTVAWITKEEYLSAGGTEAEWSYDAYGFGTEGNSNKGPITALNYLESKTANWTNIHTKNYTVSDEHGKYIVERTNARARMLSKTETLSLGCVMYDAGCPVWLYNGIGYWLSTSDTDFPITDALNMPSSGYVSGLPIYRDDYRGVRPVIEIPKTII